MEAFSSTLIDSFPTSTLTLAHHKRVNFSKVITPVKKPGCQFIIKPLTEEYLIPCAKLQAQCFCNKNNVYLYFKVPEDLYLERVVIPLVKKNIKDGIGVVCVDSKTNEVVAHVLNEDYSTKESKPVYTKKHPLLDRRGRYHDVIKNENINLMKRFPKGRFETIYVSAVSTSAKAEGLGLFTELLRFTMYEHPIIKNSKVLYSVATHPASGYAMLKSGFRMAWTKEWKEYEKIPGYEEFAGIARMEMTQGKVQKNGIMFNVFDRLGLMSRPGL